MVTNLMEKQSFGRFDVGCLMIQFIQGRMSATDEHNEKNAAMPSGIAVCVVLGVLALALGRSFPTVGGASFGLFGGVLIGNALWSGARRSPGVRWCEKKLLELAVAGMGFRLSLDMIQQVTDVGLLTVFVAVCAPLLATWALLRWLPGERRVGWLLGVGTAICGSSAIAAAAPLLGGKREEIGLSVGVVNGLGMLGIFLLPLASQMAGCSVEQSGALIGGGLHAVGHVAAAGFAVSDPVGQLAVTVKMGRVCALLPLVLVLSVVTGSRAEKAPRPWYLLGFLLTFAVSVSGVLPDSILGGLRWLDKAALCVAMVGIGLRIPLRQILGQASRSMGFAVAVWMVQLAAVALVLWCL